MSLLSAKLRKTTNGISHWCPGCDEMHVITVDATSGPNWSFDGNVDAPTCSPSVRITGKQTVQLNGKWTGEWVRDADGNAVDGCCHYFLKAGKIEFCGDCTHPLNGQTVDLPDLPKWLREA